MHKPHPWQTVNSKIVYENKWLTVKEDDVITPSGKPGIYGVIETRPFVAVIAMHQNKIIMVQQSRYTINKTTLEFPMGGIENNESPLQAAQRELKEETGYHAGNWEALSELDDAVGIARHKAYVFFAKGLQPGKIEYDNEDGIKKCVLVSPDELASMIHKGDITDTKTIALLYLVQSQLQKD